MEPVINMEIFLNTEMCFVGIEYLIPNFISSFSMEKRIR